MTSPYFYNVLPDIFFFFFMETYFMVKKIIKSLCRETTSTRYAPTGQVFFFFPYLLVPFESQTCLFRKKKKRKKHEQSVQVKVNIPAKCTVTKKKNK